MDVGARMLLAMCRDDDVFAFYKAKLHQDFFPGEEQILFNYVQEFVNKYQSLPSLDTLGLIFPALPSAPETYRFYLDKVVERYIYTTMNKRLYESQKLLKEMKLDDSVKLMSQTVEEMFMVSRRQNIVEFGQDAYDIVLSDYKTSELDQTKPKVYFGWEYLDEMSGGLGSGDVVSYVGRPAVGKTWFTLYSAHHSWFSHHRNIMVVSMEMNALSIVQRLASMHTHTAISEIKKSEIDLNKAQSFWASLIELQDHPAKLWLVDANMTATPQDIYALAHRFQVDAVFIDGAYMLKSTNPKLDRWTRVAENIETIKNLTTNVGIPTVCSYQFSREATKKKTNDQVGLEHIGYSDAIGQISSIVLGLFQEESVETIHQRKIHVMKGRDGAVGDFMVNWNFQVMDFSEIHKSDQDKKLKQDLTYI